MPEPAVDPIPIDVGHLVRRNLASLYSSLVTRPTGQAVRMAIENVLAEASAPVSLSVVDLSEVTVIDYSCADEVVAKLLLRFLREDRPRNAFFVFRGIQERHVDPIETALVRQSLVAVSETGQGRFELIGSASVPEAGAWEALERRGCLTSSDVGTGAEGVSGKTLDKLVGRRVAFRSPMTGEYQSLSFLLRASRGGEVPRTET